MNLGEKIYELRSKKGVSQEEMAFELNVSRQAVSKWETNQSLPDLDKIIALSDYFDVTLDELVKQSETSVVLEEQNSFDENKIKRRILILIKTTFLFFCLYFVWYMGILISKINIMPFPTIYFLDCLVNSIFYSTGCVLLIKRLKQNNQSIVLEIVWLVIGFAVISFILGNIISSEMNNYLSSVKTDVFLSEFIIDINEVNALLRIALFMFTVSISSTLIVRLFYPNKYVLPTEVKEYKTIDMVLSIINGVLLNILGFLFQVVWLIDAYKDNKQRFKKMLIGYIIGVVGVALLVFIYLLMDEVILS